MREINFINRIKAIHSGYSFEQPFSQYLRSYFRKNPVMGARDRREARQLCYNLFRIGKNLEELTFEERLSVAAFLCTSNENPLVNFLLKEFSDFSCDAQNLPLEDKLIRVKNTFPEFNLEYIFPMREFLADTIDRKDWYLSFLKRPKIWIRIRKKCIDKVYSELNEKLIPYDLSDDEHALSFSTEISLENTDSFKQGFFEIQDINSQATRKYFRPEAGEKWWDTCAGSGGKSLLLADQNNGVNIFATDKRESILVNYRQRLIKAAHKNFETGIFNFATDSLPLNEKFDGVIADVPCSGSGTWSRTPENLQINTGNHLIQNFIPIQRNIVSKAVSSLKVGCPFIYITCSVFKSENEENTEYFIRKLPLELENSAYLEGYRFHSDTMYVARFIRKS